MKETINTGVLLGDPEKDVVRYFFPVFPIFNLTKQDIFDMVLERHLSKPTTIHNTRSRRVYQKSISKNKAFIRR